MYLCDVQVPRCWMAWAVANVWPAVFLVGLCVQACCTGTGTHHESGLPRPVKYTKQDTQETKEESRTSSILKLL